MPLGALAVHQLRYYAAFGRAASERLHREGHGYLAVAEPLLLIVVAIAVGFSVGNLVRAWSRGAVSRGPTSPSKRSPLVRTALLCTAVLLALYCAQELAEGALAPGHPAGIAGIFGHGGLLAVPFAALVGTAIALAVRAADVLSELAARHSRRLRVPPTAARARAPGRRAAADWRLRPSSGVSAGRAPPSLAA